MQKTIPFGILTSKDIDTARTKLLELGLPFDGAKICIDGKSNMAFIVPTTDLKLLKRLAKSFKQDKLFISDSRREMFRLDLIAGKYEPTKLGKLLPVSKEVALAGNFFLLVTDNAQSYYYTAGAKGQA